MTLTETIYANLVGANFMRLGEEVTARDLADIAHDLAAAFRAEVAERVERDREKREREEEERIQKLIVTERAWWLHPEQATLRARGLQLALTADAIDDAAFFRSANQWPANGRESLFVRTPNTTISFADLEMVEPTIAEVAEE